MLPIFDNEHLDLKQLNMRNFPDVIDLIFSVNFNCKMNNRSNFYVNQFGRSVVSKNV